MDPKFRILLELDEKWTRENHHYPAMLVHLEMLDYGANAGFFKEGSDVATESDEGVAERALVAAQLLRLFVQEDVGSIINMTREQHLQVILKGDAAAEVAAQQLSAIFVEKPPLH